MHGEAVTKPLQPPGRRKSVEIAAGPAAAMAEASAPDPLAKIKRRLDRKRAHGRPAPPRRRAVLPPRAVSETPSPRRRRDADRVEAIAAAGAARPMTSVSSAGGHDVAYLSQDSLLSFTRAGAEPGGNQTLRCL